MNRERFDSLMREVTQAVAGKPLDAALADELNRRFPVGGETVTAINAVCRQAIADGWMCNKDNDGVKWGRVTKPGPETGGMSVDVVKMKDAPGAYHGHPNGEICLVLPITEEAKFDGRGAGWCVYEPQTAHYPSVSDGEAIVLYLLPDGAIDFSARPDA